MNRHALTQRNVFQISVPHAELVFSCLPPESGHGPALDSLIRMADSLIQLLGGRPKPMLNDQLTPRYWIRDDDGPHRFAVCGCGVEMNFTYQPGTTQARAFELLQDCYQHLASLLRQAWKDLSFVGGGPKTKAPDQWKA